jgi:DNA-binding MarR family transcriptional regulator
MTDRTRTQLKLTPKGRQLLERCADLTGTSMSAVVELAIRLYYAKIARGLQAKKRKG